MLKKNRPAAFDAAGASGMAFLSAQLELASTDLVEPLESVTHPRDITVEFGGGYPEFLSSYASNYGTVGGNEYGLQGTNNTDIPMVSADLNKGYWKAWIWGVGFLITFLDLKKLETAARNGQVPPFSLQDLLEKAVRLTWSKALEKVTYLGWLGQPGIINNPLVVATVAPATGTGGLTTWASKTPVQVLADFNALLLSTATASAYSLDGLADTILLDWNSNAYLLNPMTITAGGTAYGSMMEYIKANNVYTQQTGKPLKIFSVANPWIAGQGVGGTNRAVAYRNQKDALKLHIPQAAEKTITMPTSKDGGAYETIYNGCIGQVQWFRPQSAAYLDGI